MAKLLKNGKISFRLHQEEAEAAALAIKQAIEFDSLDLFHQCLLEETLEKLESGCEGGPIRLRRSEFFALCNLTVMQYLDAPTQILIRGAVEICPKP